MAFAEDKFTTSNGKNLTFKFYSHASLRIDYDGVLVYVDPVSEYADYSKEEKADIILITHDHYDHLDLKAVDSLTKNDTKIITNFESAKQTDPLKTAVLEYHKTIAIKGITIKAFEAYNTTSGRDKFHPRGRDNAYLLVIDGMRVYISGDTETIEDSEEINVCDFLFIAVNQPYTMTIEQAKMFVQRIKPKVCYPYHTTDTDMTKLKAEFDALGINTVIHAMP